MKLLDDVFSDVMEETLRARAMWRAEFDNQNTLNDWIAFTNIYLGKASSMGASKEEVVRGLRKAAGLVMNALVRAENDMLAPRHYDGKQRPVSPPEIGG